GATLVAIVASVAMAIPSSGLAETTCNYVAAPGGSDSASGSVSAPFATAQHLSDVLQPGQTGCLRAGTYQEELTFHHGGSPGQPITLTSWPGETAVVKGRTYLPRQSNYINVTRLTLDGVNAAGLPSPTVGDEHSSFIEDEVTNEHTAICFTLGFAQYGR